jgi:peptidoglycan hydrolase CwlO-like protein
VDSLTPAPTRVTLGNESQLAAAQTQITQTQNDLTAMREYARQLSMQLAQAQSKIWEQDQRLRQYQEQMRWMQAPPR